MLLSAENQNWILSSHLVLANEVFCLVVGVLQFVLFIALAVLSIWKEKIIVSYLLSTLF